MYEDYHEQVKQLGEEMVSLIRRYGMEYDLDVSSILGVLEIVKYEVLSSAIAALDSDDEEKDS